MRALTTIALLTLTACDGGGSAATTGTPDPTAAQTAAASGTTSASTMAAASVAPTTQPAAPTNGAKGPFPESTHPAMKDPTQANLTAPDTFEGKFETTAGDFVVECTRSWAPHAADRFYNLLKIGFYNDVAIYRVHPGFVAQFGLHGNPEISGKWQKAQIEPDVIKQKNKKGTLTFAQAGNPSEKGKTPITRATQVFINYKDNDHLDEAFAPVCKVTQGFEVTKTFGGEKLHKHLKNAQGRIIAKGNEFLRKTYPELDYIEKAYVVGDEPAPEGSASAKPDAPPAAPKAPKDGKGKAKLEPE